MGMRQVQAIDILSQGAYGDRGADIFQFFQACQATRTHFLVRVAQKQCVEVGEDEISYSLTKVRAFPSQASPPFEFPARHSRQVR